jgi:acetyl-CoA carboxylase biotin carboxyl carrier protein
MTVEEIKELIHVVNESGIAELEVQRGENRVRIRRSNTPPSHEIVVAPASSPAALAASQATALPQNSGVTAPVAATPSAHVTPQVEIELLFVKSPIVGTYYDAPSPGSPPFVKVGDRVIPGQALCIIESMKLMNEIEAEVSGILVKTLVENGRPVEYGEALFGIQPA